METPHNSSHSPAAALLRATLIGALLLSFLLVSSPTTQASVPSPDSTGFAVMSLPPEAMTVPVLLTANKTVEGEPKMESSLSQLAATAQLSKSAAIAMAESEQLRRNGDRIQILVTTDADRADSATAAIAAAGGEVTGRANGDTWLQAWAPVDALGTIAADESIDHIGRPAEAVTMATTEGSAVINAPAWHASGQTGAGVKVAVIDAGFMGYPDLRGSELPLTVTVKNFVDFETDMQVNGTTKHGTACAEIVHDIAPNATIYLAKVDTKVDLEEAVNWAYAQGVNIITTSLGWYNQTPGDGTGFFADLVQSARNAGIFWTTAAGNDRQAHWGGAFNGDEYGYHSYSATQNVNFFGPGDGDAYLIPKNYPIRVFLRWDDWTAVNENYNLYVLRWSGSQWDVVGSSEDAQSGGAGQTPTEYVGVSAYGDPAPYGFIIHRKSGSRNVNLEAFAPKLMRLDQIVTGRSLANLADSPAAMTVAALDVNSPYPQETYSSEGPTNGPGGSPGGGATKPDIAGFANVSTISYGTTAKFNGTSSATPHVAGAAALLKGLFPAYGPDQIQAFLQAQAIDMGVPGRDNAYGWGRLNLPLPPRAVLSLFIRRR